MKIPILLIVFITSSIIFATASAEEGTFRLTLKAEPNIIFISGSGEYDENELVIIDSAPEVWRDYFFIGWKIDGRWTGEDILTIRMDRDHSAIAVYERTDQIGGLVIDTIPRITEITVDGKIYLPSELPLSFSWSAGSEHIIVIPETVSEGPDTRYMFDSWKDQNMDLLRTVSASNDGEYIALYKTQYYLKAISDHGAIIGGGWNDASSTVDFELESDIVFDKKDENIRYVFNSWNKGDYLNSATNTIAIEDPTTVKADWDTQYKLQLQTDVPGYDIFGTGWYDVGRKVALIAEEKLDSPDSNINYVFDKWISKGPNPVIIPNAHSPSTTITVEEPYLITAQYKKSYRVNVWTPFGSASGDGFYPEGEVAEIKIANTAVIVYPNQERKIFSGWDTHGARSMDFMSSGSAKDILGNGVGNQNLLLFVDRPANVTAKWKTQYYLNVISTESSANGAGWYDLGKLAAVSVGNPTSPPDLWSAHQFSKWTGDIDTASTKARVLMNQPKTVEAIWTTDSTPGIVNSMILAGIVGVVVVVFKKTHFSDTIKQRYDRNRSSKINGTQEEPFDRFFDLKTRTSNAGQHQPFIQKQSKLQSIFGWLMGRNN